jgi:hypothetical protein
MPSKRSTTQTISRSGAVLGAASSSVPGPALTPSSPTPVASSASPPRGEKRPSSSPAVGTRRSSRSSALSDQESDESIPSPPGSRRSTPPDSSVLPPVVPIPPAPAVSAAAPPSIVFRRPVGSSVGSPSAVLGVIPSPRPLDVRSSAESSVLRDSVLQATNDRLPFASMYAAPVSGRDAGPSPSAPTAALDAPRPTATLDAPRTASQAPRARSHHSAVFGHPGTARPSPQSRRFNEAVYGDGHPWVPPGQASRLSHDPAMAVSSSTPHSGFPAGSQRGSVTLDPPAMTVPVSVPPVSALASAPPVEQACGVQAGPVLGSQTRPFSEVELDAALLPDIRARFARGEHLGSEDELKEFIRTRGHLFTAEQARMVAAIVLDRNSIATYAGVGQTAANASSLVAPLSAPIGTLSAMPDPACCFVDFDNFSHVCDSRSASAVSAACTSFNSDIMRWRFLGPRTDSARVRLCPPSTPFACDYDALRDFITQEVSVNVDADRHPLLQGVSNAPLWSAFLFLEDLSWLASPRVFGGLAALNFGSFARPGKLRLSPAYFYRVGGVGGDRDVAVKAFYEHVRLPTFSGAGVVTCFVSCLAGVLLCPDLIREAQIQGLEDKFLIAARLCSDQVMLMQFFKAVTNLTDLASNSHRGSSTESRPGSGVTLEVLFRDRVQVAAWFVAGLADALAISDAARWPSAKANATEWLLRGSTPIAGPGVSTPAPQPSSPPVGKKPCLYSFLEQFRPALSYKCRLPACQFNHDFSLGEAAYMDAIRSYVENANPSSTLGSHKAEVLAALAGGA